MILQLILCIIVPLALMLWHSYTSYHRLLANPYFSLSPLLLKIFIISRAVYIFIFTMMTIAFALSIINYNVSGEAARLLIASADRSSADLPALILAIWSKYYLPIIFAAVFTSIITLGYMGRLVLVKYAADGAPPKHLNGFRFTFFILAMTLIMPPLIFASLLLV